MMRQWIAVKQIFKLAPAAAAFLFLLKACPQELRAAGVPQPTRTSLAVDATDARTTLTAHVTDALGRAIAPAASGDAGAVSFELATGTSSGAALGSALVDADGDATLTLPGKLALGAGPNSATSRADASIRAVYQPLASAESLAASASPAVQLRSAASAVPDFLLTANPSTVSTTAGQYATTAITVTPQNGFSEQVTLSCNNLPAQVTCNFSPGIQSTAHGPFTSTLELQTQTGSGSLTQPDFGQHHMPGVTLAWLLPGALVLLGFAACRRRLQGFTHIAGIALVMALALAAGAIGLVGCSQRYGYIHHPPLAAGGTPSGTYTIDVSAGGNNGSAVTTHDYNVVLQVK